MLSRTLELTHIGKTREEVETDNWEASLDIPDLGSRSAIPVGRSRAGFSHLCFSKYERTVTKRRCVHRGIKNL